MPEQSGDSFDFCVLFRVYFIGKGASDRMRTQEYTAVICMAECSVIALPEVVPPKKRA